MIKKVVTKNFIFRKAKRNDLSEILRLLAEDELGRTRETIPTVEIDPCYRAAFEEIDSDQNQALMVVEENNKIIGICHLTYMPSLTFQGAKGLNIEAVRIDQTCRNLVPDHKSFQTFLAHLFQDDFAFVLAS